MEITEELRQELLHACRLGLRAAYHACDHPESMIERGAKRSCGACRAAVALLAVIAKLEAAGPPLARKKRGGARDHRSRDCT